MAAEQGGNCELTEPGQAVVKHGVTIVGYTDLASRMAKQTSTLYSNNLLRLTEELCKTKDGVINVNMDDDAIRGLTVIKDGEVTWPAPPIKLPAPPPKPPAAAVVPSAAKGHGGGGGPMSAKGLAIVFGLGALAFLLVGLYAPASFLSHFTVFVLACFVGYMVIQIAPPLTDAGADRPTLLILGMAVLALGLTGINMFGGFAVTRRMLAMFQK